MELRNINNYFGDMDLFLMDLILKGHIPDKGKVLDIGCGEGRNGLFFIQNGYEYHGWDNDTSALKLVEYLTNSIKGSNAHFREVDLHSIESDEKFDLLICSRVLHFAKSEGAFYTIWDSLTSLLNKGAILYLSMDSTIDNSLGENLKNGLTEFPDYKVRFALTSEIYKSIKKGFEEIEPLRTLVHHNSRAQSFMALKKL